MLKAIFWRKPSFSFLAVATASLKSAAVSAGFAAGQPDANSVPAAVSAALSAAGQSAAEFRSNFDPVSRLSSQGKAEVATRPSFTSSG